MFRAIVIAFIAGWALWFWIDKSPQALGPLPPPQQEQLGANFQVAVDLIKAQRYTAAYVYLWKAHYLILAVAAGLMVSMIGGSLTRLRGRRRFARLYTPARKRRSEGEPGAATEQGKQDAKSD
jgi:hypothetical protein